MFSNVDHCFSLFSTRQELWENESRENERKRKDRQIFGSCLRAEKAVEHEDRVDSNCCGNS